MARPKLEKGSLLKDWFGRRKENSYTHKDNTNKLFNWDKNRESLSSYFISNDSAISEAAKVTSSMFGVLNVNKHSRYDKSNRVKLPLGLLKKEEPNEENTEYHDFIDEIDYEKLDAFYGASLQEASKHSLQSREEYISMLNNEKKRKKGKGTVKSVLSEILNTERLDKKLAERYPGYIKFVQKFKDYSYDKNYEAPSKEEDEKIRLMDTIFKMLRYPTQVDDETYKEFQEPLNQIERLIKKFGGIPETKKECDSMATSLSNIIYKYISEEEKEESGGGDKGEGEDEEKREISKSDLDKKASDIIRDFMADSEKDNYTDSDQDDFNDEMESCSKESNIDYNDPDYENVTRYSKIQFTKSGINKTLYNNVRDKIDFTKAQVIRKLFERKSKDYDFAIKGMRSGRLDAAKIAEAKQGVPTVYERIANVSTNKVMIGILVDESGSMSGTRIAKAREAAIFINEIFKKMHDIELYIYGHTADQGGTNSVNMMVYKEPGFQDDQHALGSITARSNNRDGDAIYAVGKRIRNITENNGILFVISDGQPAAHGYNGSSGVKHTRKMVSMTQNLGFQVIQIAIDEDVPSSEMFDYYIKMTNIKTFPKDLVNYMSTKVDNLIKTTVSM